jgi:glycosyltransferase involved in cell wall biosynthesis
VGILFIAKFLGLNYTVSSMKTCFIHNLYPPCAKGGAETVVLGLAKAGVKKGNQIIVITLGDKQTPSVAIEDGVKVYRLLTPNIFSYNNLSRHCFAVKLFWHLIDIYNYRGARRIKKILLQERPDIVNTHNLMGLGFGIPRIIQKLGIKHIHTLHDVQLIDPSGILLWNHVQDNIWQKIYQWLMKKRMGKPDIVIFLSEFIRKFYLKRGFFVNRVWRKLEIRNYEIRNKEINTNNKISNCPKRFLFVGSLSEYKGIKVLMRAWRKCRKANCTL